MSMVRRFLDAIAARTILGGGGTRCARGFALHSTTTRSIDGNVWQEGERQGREGDAREEARHAEERRLGQEGDEPQAGHRDRPVGSARGRRQGAGEEVGCEEGGCEEVRCEEVDREE